MSHVTLCCLCLLASQIFQMLGLHSLCQRHWNIENTCAPIVYFYGLTILEDPPTQCITLQRQEPRATLQTQKHDGQGDAPWFISTLQRQEHTADSEQVTLSSAQQHDRGRHLLHMTHKQVVACKRLCCCEIQLKLPHSWLTTRKCRKMDISAIRLKTRSPRFLSRGLGASRISSGGEC
jgi:hypothetical protein